MLLLDEGDDLRLGEQLGQIHVLGAENAHGVAGVGVVGHQPATEARHDAGDLTMASVESRSEKRVWIKDLCPGTDVEVSTRSEGGSL